MSTNDDLVLAWLAHRDGLPARRDALLTLAVASAGINGQEWVERVRKFLVNSRPGHLYSGFGPVDEALSDPRVVSSIVRLRYSYPPARVRWLVQQNAVARGPYRKQSPSVAAMVDDLLAPVRTPKFRPAVRLGTASKNRSVPVGILAPVGPATPRDAGLPETSGPLLAFYISVLLGVAALCTMVLESQRDDRRAA